MLSSGPGLASEWYWMAITGSSRMVSPSTVPSFRFTWLTSAEAANPSGSTAYP